MVYLRITDGNGERRFDLLDAIVSVGRAPENQIILDDKEASRRQCTIERVEEGYKLVDLESRNGTRVNGKFENQHLLRPGDTVEIGKCRLTYEDPNYKGPPRQPDPAPAAVPIEDSPAPAPTSVPNITPAPATDTVDSRKSETAGVRRRSGRTSTIARIPRRGRTSGEYEKTREKNLIRNFAIFAVIFFLGIFSLIFIGSITGDPPDTAKQEQLLIKAEGEWEERPEYWKTEMEKITPAHGEGLHKRAQAVIRKIESHLASRVRDNATEEERDYEGIERFRLDHPFDHDRIISMCEEYIRKHTINGKFAAEVQKWIDDAKSGKTKLRASVLVKLKEKVDKYLREEAFASAMREVERVMGKYGDDVDVHDKIIEEQGKVVTEAGKYYLRKDKEAKGLADTGRDGDAKMVYREILEAMGSGEIGDLKPLCDRAEAQIRNLDQ